MIEAVHTSQAAAAEPPAQLVQQLQRTVRAQAAQIQALQAQIEWFKRLRCPSNFVFQWAGFMPPWIAVRPAC